MKSDPRGFLSGVKQTTQQRRDIIIHGVNICPSSSTSRFPCVETIPLLTRTTIKNYYCVGSKRLDKNRPDSLIRSDQFRVECTDFMNNTRQHDSLFLFFYEEPLSLSFSLSQCTRTKILVYHTYFIH